MNVKGVVHINSEFKVSVFNKQLGYVKDPKIKAFAEKAIGMLPDYFFEVAASSTGKYHPAYALGNGGLVRHTKAAVEIANEMYRMEMYDRVYSAEQKDLMLVALMLHDGWKHGPDATAGKYTVAEHPTVCADWIKAAPELTEMLTPEQIDFLCGCIASHMGQWCTDYKSGRQILPKPATPAQKYVHMADYLASRKFLLFDFGDDYYEGVKAEPVETESPAEKDPVLTDTVNSIIEKCKTLTEKGVKRNDMYAVISDLNGGNRNPNSITDAATAKEILKKLEDLDV